MFYALHTGCPCLNTTGATKARVEVNLIDGEVTVIYEDDGRGFDLANRQINGMGLQNIRRRAALINGRLTIESSERGTTCILEVKNDE